MTFPFTYRFLNLKKREKNKTKILSGKWASSIPQQDYFDVITRLFSPHGFMSKIAVMLSSNHLAIKLTSTPKETIKEEYYTILSSPFKVDGENIQFLDGFNKLLKLHKQLTVDLA